MKFSNMSTVPSSSLSPLSPSYKPLDMGSDKDESSSFISHESREDEYKPRTGKSAVRRILPHIFWSLSMIFLGSLLTVATSLSKDHMRLSWTYETGFREEILCEISRLLYPRISLMFCKYLQESSSLNNGDSRLQSTSSLTEQSIWSKSQKRFPT